MNGVHEVKYQCEKHGVIEVTETVIINIPRTGYHKVICAQCMFEKVIELVGEVKPVESK